MASYPMAALDLGFVSATGRPGGTMPSSWAVFSRLYRREGASAFVKGIVPRAYANCPGMIAMKNGTKRGGMPNELDGSNGSAMDE